MTSLSGSVTPVNAISATAGAGTADGLTLIPRGQSSSVRMAQSSGAQVIGLANAGADTIIAIKQAAEFGVTPKEPLAGLLMFITDVHSLGLKTTQGMYLTEGFYWDLNDETRAWSKRFFAQHKRMPTMVDFSLDRALLS